MPLKACNIIHRLTAPFRHQSQCAHMKKKILTSSLLCLSFICLSGCGPSYYYKYTAPKTEAGISCVKGCQEARTQCRHIQSVEDDSRQAASIANRNIYRSCVIGRTDKDARKYCGASSPYDSNYNDFNFLNPTCEDDFNQCFEICGGGIERILERE